MKLLILIVAVSAIFSCKKTGGSEKSGAAQTGDAQVSGPLQGTVGGKSWMHVLGTAWIDAKSNEVVISLSDNTGPTSCEYTPSGVVHSYPNGLKNDEGSGVTIRILASVQAPSQAAPKEASIAAFEPGGSGMSEPATTEKFQLFTKNQQTISGYYKGKTSSSAVEGNFTATFCTGKP